MTDIRIPASLRDGLQNRSLVLFAGAGLSKLAGAPLWTELLEGLVQNAEDEGIELSGTYEQALTFAQGNTEQKLALASHLRERMRNAFGEYVRRRLEGQTPDEIHRRLVELNWTGFITTNYDTLIEDAYYDVHGRRLRLITWTDTDELGRLDELEAWIVKIHGCVTRTNTIVLDDSSLKQLLEAGTTAEVLRGLFRRYSIVFVGYGLGDPDVMPELRRLSAVFGSAARRHYALLSDFHEAPFWRHYLEQRYSVQPLIYSISGNHRAGLAAWVDELRVQAQYEGRASRKKLLFLVKALRQRGAVPRDVVLVTDDIPRWGVLRAPEDEVLGYPMEKAYLFPPVDDSGQDRIAAAAAFAENAGLPGEAVGALELDEPSRA